MSTNYGRRAMVPISALIAVLLSMTPAAAGVDDFPGQTELEMQQATARQLADGLEGVRVVAIYELDPEGLHRMVALEYIVPATFGGGGVVDTVALAEALGQRLRTNGLSACQPPG